ncbi:MAG: hypothetical protein IPN76_17885 [Saprospiraceae bacterium]|jgi:hypothetical protein|nr:hypothetical protein [Saprospiraceae bacterium]
MPLEIRELVIKSTVVPESGGNQDAGAAGGGENASGDKETFVNQIVEKVLEVLRQKEER